MSRITETYQLEEQTDRIKSLNDTDLLHTTLKIAETLGIAKFTMKDNRGEVEQDLMAYSREILNRMRFAKPKTKEDN